MPLVELHRALVPLCRCAGRERAKVAAPAVFGFFLREQTRYLPDVSFRIMAFAPLKCCLRIKYCRSKKFLRAQQKEGPHDGLDPTRLAR